MTTRTDEKHELLMKRLRQPGGTGKAFALRQELKRRGVPYFETALNEEQVRNTSRDERNQPGFTPRSAERDT